jgi:hypothetical protein
MLGGDSKLAAVAREPSMVEALQQVEKKGACTCY